MRFVNKLRNNIKHVLSVYPEVTVYFDRDRGHVYLNGADYQEVSASLKKILVSKILHHLIRLKSLFQP